MTSLAVGIIGAAAGGYLATERLEKRIDRVERSHKRVLDLRDETGLNLSPEFFASYFPPLKYDLERL